MSSEIVELIEELLGARATREVRLLRLHTHTSDAAPDAHSN